MTRAVKLAIAFFVLLIATCILVTWIAEFKPIGPKVVKPKVEWKR